MHVLVYFFAYVYICRCVWIQTRTHTHTHTNTHIPSMQNVCMYPYPHFPISPSTIRFIPHARRCRHRQPHPSTPRPQGYFSPTDQLRLELRSEAHCPEDLFTRMLVRVIWKHFRMSSCSPATWSWGACYFENVSLYLTCAVRFAMTKAVKLPTCRMKVSLTCWFLQTANVAQDSSVPYRRCKELHGCLKIVNLRLELCNICT